MVSDFTDLDPLDMYQRLKKVEEPRVSNSDELFSQTVSSPYRHGVSSQPASVPEMTRVYKPLVSAPMMNCTPSSLILQILSAIILPTPGSLNNSHLLQVFKVFEKVT
jgi:hypothetical protein